MGYIAFLIIILIGCIRHQFEGFKSEPGSESGKCDSVGPFPATTYFDGTYFYKKGLVGRQRLPVVAGDLSRSSKIIEPQIYWTHKYLSEQFPSIVHDLLTKLDPEPPIFGYKNRFKGPVGMVGPIDTVGQGVKWNIGLPSILETRVRQIITYLYQGLQIGLGLKFRHRYLHESIVVQILMKPNLNTIKWGDAAQIDCVAELIFEPTTGSSYKIVQTGVVGLPRYKSYKGYDTNQMYAGSDDYNKVQQDDPVTEEILSDTYDDRMHYITTKCSLSHIPDKLHVSKKQNTHNERACVVMGGKWEHKNKVK